MNVDSEVNVDSDKSEVTALAQENQRLREALARAQHELGGGREEIARLRSTMHIVAQTARIWIWQSDIKGDFAWDVNRPANLGLEDISIADLGLRYFAMIDTDDLHSMLERHFAALEAKASFITHRHKVRCPDGSVRHLEGRGAILYDANGAPYGVVGVTLDVTSEVEAADQLCRQTAELRDAQRRLEHASISSQAGHWDVNLKTRQCWVSSSYYALLGFPAECVDLSSREKYLERVHPEDQPREQEAIVRHIDEGMPLAVEIRMRRADGEWRWMRMRGTAEFDAHRKPIRLSGSIQDIHQQKLAEDNLLEVRQRFERAIRGTQDGLWELDMEKQTLWVSPRYQAIMGYEEGEMPPGIEFRKALTHPDDLQRVTAAYEAHHVGSGSLDLESRVRHASGRYIWIRARGEAERDATGKPIRVAGSIQDITEARMARDALIQATEAAQAANRAKGDFLANMSHEIRTPMNGIIGMTALLLDGPMDATQREYAQTIRGSADSLLTIINDILDFSKIEAGKLDIETIELNLRSTVEEVGAMMALQAAQKNLELIVDMGVGLPDRLGGDPQRIRQCLVNLVGNAIKFTLSGEILIAVSVVGRSEGRVLTRFEVRDTGIGVAPETAQGLFQPFVQADSSTTRHYGGTGLGLSIVRRLVEMMGGEVGVEGAVGKGSTFWFTLPLAADESDELQSEAAAAQVSGRLLLVDDNETCRRVLANQLETAGYDVTTAADGEQALSSMRRAQGRGMPFHAVVTDLQMPQMDGRLLGARIRSDPDFAATPILLLTSLDRAGEHANIFDACMAKPVRTRDLLEAIDGMLNGRSRVASSSSRPAPLPQHWLDETVQGRHAWRILVVEDNAVNQKVAQRFLERLGCQVVIADNGKHAVSKCATEHFDLVLMDLQMPVMDGYVATSEIRALERTGSRTPIIALTASAMTGQLERCLAADMDGLLTKPLSVERLGETLHRFGLGADPQAMVVRASIKNR